MKKLDSSATSILRPISSRAARYPIETISICLLVASCCYFSLVHFFQAPANPAEWQFKYRRFSFGPGLPIREANQSLDTITTPLSNNIVLKQIIVDSPKQSAYVSPLGVMVPSVLRSVLEIQRLAFSLKVTDPNHGNTFGISEICQKFDKPVPAEYALVMSEFSGCVILSPTGLWGNSFDDLTADENILAT
ncbi:hypothetical protein HK096_010452, partial [Nowakowskiella sp. JEL0078]